MTEAPDAARMEASNISGQRCVICGDTDPPESGACIHCGASPSALLPGRGSGALGIKVIGLVTGEKGPFDGEWLMGYDPFRGVLTTTPDSAAALRFENFQAARREWMRWDGTDRPDGKPSRPLTAYTVELAAIPDQPPV